MLFKVEEQFQFQRKHKWLLYIHWSWVKILIWKYFNNLYSYCGVSKYITLVHTNLHTKIPTFGKYEWNNNRVLLLERLRFLRISGSQNTASYAFLVSSSIEIALEPCFFKALFHYEPSIALSRNVCYVTKMLSLCLWNL